MKQNSFDSNKYLFCSNIFCLNETNFILFKQIISLNQRKSFEPIILFDSIKYFFWVYLGDAVVKNHKGKASLKFANANEIPITLSVPIVNLEDFEEKERYKRMENLHNFKQTNKDSSSTMLNNFLRTDNSLINSCKFYNATVEDRVECTIFKSFFD